MYRSLDFRFQMSKIKNDYLFSYALNEQMPLIEVRLCL